MRKLCCALFILAAVSFAHAQQAGETAPKPESFAGTWTGSWDGAGAGGGFELTLEQPKEGPMTGRVSVTGEPSYKATFKSLSFEGKKMTAKYDFTPDDQAEVALTATFDGNKATGSWALRAKATGDEVASGGFTVSRK